MTPFRISRFTPRARSPIPTIFSHPRTSGRSMAALAFLVAVLLMLTACGGATTDATSGAGSGGTAQTTAEKTFTTEELAAFNGQNGNPAYIAVDGVVYDVTKVSTWGARLHNGQFKAGKDYSEEIKKAPHGVDKLLTAVRIGVLKP